MRLLLIKQLSHIFQRKIHSRRQVSILIHLIHSTRGIILPTSFQNTFNTKYFNLRARFTTPNQPMQRNTDARSSQQIGCFVSFLFDYISLLREREPFRLYYVFNSVHFDWGMGVVVKIHFLSYTLLNSLFCPALSVKKFTVFHCLGDGGWVNPYKYKVSVPVPVSLSFLNFLMRMPVPIRRPA